MEETGVELENPELMMLINNKESGYNYRQRRSEPWLENYTLYRDKVTVNRLTQRQSVNVPLMKMSVKTLLKEIDDMPVLHFENLDNDKEAEVFKNEYWNYTDEQNKMELQDLVDKKQVLLFGRSFDQWQIADGKVKQTIQDPEDILVSRFMDPTDLHSSRFLIHTHIFVPLTTLEENKDYDKQAVKDLKEWYATELGIVKVKDNLKMMVDKNKKMEEMGVPDVDSPTLGETYVELTLHFLFHKEEGDTEEEIYLYVEADEKAILMKKKLEEVIGTTKDHFWRNHYPYATWGSDLERQDFWSDAVGDTVRTPNKIVNSFFSQMVENRTLRNFGMQYYDSTNKDFQPSTYNPVAWGWYGVPGKPSEVVQKVDIPDLSESLDEISFIMELVEKATGATATQQGVQTERSITLGEVELALGEAKEIARSVSKFYTQAWKDRGLIFIKLVEAASDQLDAVKIYKKGRNTDDIYEREVAPKDWKTPAGYRCKVWSQDEKNAKDTEALQKLAAVKANMPLNPKVDEIYKRKLSEFAGLTPDEISEIMEFEDTNRQALLKVQEEQAGAGTQAEQAQQMPNQQL